MSENFGARLRAERERQQIVLATIVSQTKIKLSLLEELERDDVSQWPMGIFRRAYVRAYAQAIGLEPDVIVREFLERHPDPMVDIEPVSTIASRLDATSSNAGPPTRLRNLVDSAIGSLPLLRSRSSSAPAPATGDLPPAGDWAPATTVPDPFTPVEEIDRVAQVVRVEPAAEVKAVEPDSVIEAVGAMGRVEAVEPILVPAAPDFSAAANWCTALSRVDDACEVMRLLGEAAGLVGAVGLIVWVWDGCAGELRPTLAHGYSEGVLAHIPALSRHADNATAAAFRSARTCTVPGDDRGPGALVVPMMTPLGCAGVLAVELQDRREQSDATRALVVIFAAQLARVPAVVGTTEEAARRLA
jgi:hypothetical protein